MRIFEICLVWKSGIHFKVSKLPNFLDYSDNVRIYCFCFNCLIPICLLVTFLNMLSFVAHSNGLALLYAFMYPTDTRLIRASVCSGLGITGFPLGIRVCISIGRTTNLFFLWNSSICSSAFLGSDGSLSDGDSYVLGDL